MDSRVPRTKYPLWVKLSIWGVPGRRGVQAYIGLSIALGLASMVYGLFHREYLVGGFIGVAAIPYWLAMRWVDEHGSWERDVQEGGTH